ncbi:FecR family protein [Chitinophaga arvensicola]|uniref:FecR protein n=1 Tax=Chitinophaga arvensicola TaxID=29529 RepID=A0A1I0QRR5_9BACT|nr:FecR domain-containing protein [Chitinophaga arvensicola]SEW30280.1 protein of unknown function [Chitinophaga arvensicola]
MQENKLISLYHKAVNGNISDEEREELFTLLSDPEARELYESLFKWGATKTNTDEQQDFFTRSQASALLERIRQESHQQQDPQPAPVVKLKVLLAWTAAAVILVLLSAGTYLLWNKPLPAETEKVFALQAPASLPAAKTNNVMLTLSDGRQVALDSISPAQIIEEKGSRAVNSEKGALTYMSEPVNAAPEVAFNTLSTPRGKYYKLVLPDGTRVYLNAASSLRYPTSFTKDQRKVELTGEAYFEVIKDADKPFLVITGKQSLSVLGTSFNVKAYTDEPYTRTTLVEGSIKIDPKNGSAARILQPGEQATVEGSKIIVKRTDVKEDISWMSDMFYFSNTDLQDVAHQLQRWYDIEVDYASLPDAHLYGQLPRSTPLPLLLKAIGKTSNIKLNLSKNQLLLEH